MIKSLLSLFHIQHLLIHQTINVICSVCSIVKQLIYSVCVCACVLVLIRVSVRVRVHVLVCAPTKECIVKAVVELDWVVQTCGLIISIPKTKFWM